MFLKMSFFLKKKLKYVGVTSQILPPAAWHPGPPARHLPHTPLARITPPEVVPPTLCTKEHHTLPVPSVH